VQSLRNDQTLLEDGPNDIDHDLDLSPESDQSWLDEWSMWTEELEAALNGQREDIFVPPESDSDSEIIV
jgi:hypothetical protein